MPKVGDKQPFVCGCQMKKTTGSSKDLSKQQCSLIAVKPWSLQDLFVIHSEQNFQRKLNFNPAIISVIDYEKHRGRSYQGLWWHLQAHWRMGSIPGKDVVLKNSLSWKLPYSTQYLITLGFFPFNFFLGYVYLSPILTMFPPPHWCSGSVLTTSWQ